MKKRWQKNRVTPALNPMFGNAGDAPLKKSKKPPMKGT